MKNLPQKIIIHCVTDQPSTTGYVLNFKFSVHISEVDDLLDEDRVENLPRENISINQYFAVEKSDVTCLTFIFDFSDPKIKIGSSFQDPTIHITFFSDIDMNWWLNGEFKSK